MSVLNFSLKVSTFQIVFDIKRDVINDPPKIKDEFEYANKIREAAENQFFLMGKQF